MAEQLNLSSSEAIEYFFDRGWTDGLPVVPPTPDLVEEFWDECETSFGSLARAFAFLDKNHST